jgi:Glutathione S-transferase, C-terminal domain
MGSPVEMYLPADASGHALAVKVLLQRSQGQADGSVAVKTGSPALTMTRDGASIEGINTVCTELCRAVAPDLLGVRPSDTAQVRTCDACLRPGAPTRHPVPLSVIHLLRPVVLHHYFAHGLQIEQWLNFVHTQLTPIMDDKLAEVNAWLATRTFMLGATPSLADVVLYAALSPAIVRCLLRRRHPCHLPWVVSHPSRSSCAAIWGRLACSSCAVCC